MMQIGNIIKQALEAPPKFGTRYDPRRMDFYLNINEAHISNFLITQCNNPENPYEEIGMFLKTNDKQILEDFKQVLIDSIIEKYINMYDENPSLEKETTIVQKEIRLLLEKNVQHLIFKRTANTCTPYGFI